MEVESLPSGGEIVSCGWGGAQTFTAFSCISVDLHAVYKHVQGIHVITVSWGPIRKKYLKGLFEGDRGEKKV